MDDLEEYECIKREQECKERLQDVYKDHQESTAETPKSKQDIINERIGYQPQPRNPQ